MIRSVPQLTCARYRNAIAGSNWLCSFDRWHRHSGNLEVHRAEEIPVGEIERAPFRATEGKVGGLGLAVNDAAEFLALGIEDVNASRATTIDIPRQIHLHAVRHPG